MGEMDKLWKLAELSRRELLERGLVTGVVTGFALAAQPVIAQTTILTPADDLEAGMIALPVGAETIPAYRAAPKGGGPRPLVLVVQEIFGVHEHIKDVCRRLAKAGYLAIAPELYHRQGDVSKLASIDEIRPVVGKVPDAQVMGDLDAAVRWATSTGAADPAKLAITGFCWGGRVVWMYAAHNPSVQAGVAWYGRLVGDQTANTPRHPVEIARDIKGAVLGLYGEADAGIPLSTVEEMRRALGTPSRSQIHVYPGAPHAFFADYRPSYRKEAADDGWRRCLAWLKEHGVA